MIPAHLKFGRELEQLLHESGPDCKSDRDLAELIAPIALVRLVELLGRPHARKLVEEALEVKTPKAQHGIGQPCWRISICGRSAVEERLDANGSGIWRPVCPDHAKGALPLERRALRGFT